MQLARIGEIGAMQNLFTTKKLTASHRDEEGITPLHVCLHPLPHAIQCFRLGTQAMGIKLTATMTSIVGSH